MVRTKIQRWTAKGKKFKVSFMNPETWRQKTIQFWQEGSHIKPWTQKAKNFIARHRAGKWWMTIKKHLNEKTWRWAKIWDTINISSKFL
jgi:hypothetical protein